MDKPFRFAVQVGRAESAERWATLARRIEDLGYDTLAVPDHFGDQFGPFPALVAAAAATQRLRVGTLVLDNDFLHPVVLARDAATTDVLTGGRLELGVGAGWMTSDYERSGIPMESPSTRIDRLAETLEILGGLFSDGPFTYKGEHYAITELDGQPKPVQRPRPPLVIGGGGQRVLTLAGRHADIVGVNFNLRAGEVTAEMGADGTAERTARKVEWVRDAAGDRFEDLELQVLVIATVVTEDAAPVAEGIAGNLGLTPEQVMAIPHFLIGNVGQIIEKLHSLRERFGFSYFTIQGGMKDFAPVVAELAGK